jgi:hypothetical protein
MDLSLWLLLCVGFMAGYAMRELISRRRRREARRIHEARERLMQSQASRYP